MNVAAIVVSYNPESTAIENMSAILEQVDLLCIVDNSLAGVPEKLINFVAASDKAVFIENKNKGGIAGALNVGCKYAIEKKEADAIILFDQDSRIPSDFVVNQLEFVKENDVSVAVPLYFDVNSRTYGNYVRLNRYTFNTIFGNPAIGPFQTTFAITSGTLMRSDVFLSVGYFSEKYFIDHVDSDYCIRIRKAGYAVLVNSAICFKHAIGSRENRKLLGITFKPNFHSPLRRYYTVRNAVFLIKDWGLEFPALIALLLLMNLYQFLGVLLYEDNKINKFKAGLRGVVDGVLGNGGARILSL